MEGALIKVLAFVCVIAAGYVMGHSGKLGSTPGAFVSNIVFTITLPCAIIHAFGAADFTYDLLLLVPLGFMCAFGAYLIALTFTIRSERKTRIFYLLNSCGFNIGCFALPFVQALFSPTMVVATCLFDAGNAFMVTGGSYALTGLVAGSSRVGKPLRFVAKRLFSSVPFDTYLVLIALAALNVRLPQEILLFTEPIANANSFLAMFMLGLMMSFSVSRERIAKVARLVGLRAAFGMVLTCIVWLALPIDDVMRTLLTLLVWSPASALAPMYTQMSGGDGGLAGFANALTIILGVIAATFITLTLV